MYTSATKIFKSINIKGQLMTFDVPKIMGILNVTPDSFYDGGKNESTAAIHKKVEQFIAEGADMIDVGGQSTRPGSTQITDAEEMSRVLPVITYINKTYPSVLVSIDTFRASVAKAALEAGAGLVNDVSAGNLDPEIINVVAQHKVPYVAMHSKGDSSTMQKLTDYTHLTKEIMMYFAQKIEQLQNAGVADIIIDPGFGFAKKTEQNYELLQNIVYLQELKKPVLVGLSRKSMIYTVLEVNPEQALNGTSILNTWAILQGADILRVHDVKEAKQVVNLCLKLKS